MGLSNIASIDTKQLEDFKNREYFDPGRGGYDFDAVCRVKFLATSEEIEKSKQPRPNYEGRFEYPTPIEVLADNRKNERNQEGRILTWHIPQDIINLIVRQVGDAELKHAEMIVRADLGKGAKRYYRSEVVKGTIRKATASTIPNDEASTKEVKATPNPMPIQDIATDLQSAIAADNKRNYNCIPVAHAKFLVQLLTRARSKSPRDLLNTLDEILRSQLRAKYINTRAFIEQLRDQTTKEVCDHKDVN